MGPGQGAGGSGRAPLAPLRSPETPAGGSGDGAGDGATPENGRVATCPFCGGRDTRLLATWGSLLMTSQHACDTCRTTFECVRDESD